MVVGMYLSANSCHRVDKVPRVEFFCSVSGIRFLSLSTILDALQSRLEDASDWSSKTGFVLEDNKDVERIILFFLIIVTIVNV
jgi:hypothetical protein